jgi:hypothetical protein
MRFMLLMIPRSYAMPSADAVARMARYNDALTKAGVLLALDGLHPPSAGTRVAFAAGKATATDGPFAESREVVGGYWLIDVKSKDEAVAWASRCPAADGDVIEVRRVQESSDWKGDV